MKAVQVLKLKPLMSVKDSDKFEGKVLKPVDCQLLIRDKDTDIYDAESGKCLAKFRKGIIPPYLQLKTYHALLKAAKTTTNRGSASGGAGFRRILKDGSISKTNYAIKGVDSGVIGYFDRNPRFPNCRLTAFNKYEFEKFKEAYPIIKLVDNKYAELMPVEYGRQKVVASKTSKDFIIRGTTFTTVTVNKNYQTAVHKDAGDFKEGFGNLVAIRKGTYSGCYLTLPRWGCGFDLQNGDLLLMDVHQWHGNTPMVLDDPKAVRLSLVMYYREKMIHCGTMEEELKRVQNRKKGEKLS